MFVIGAENLPSSMYTPLVVLLAAYAVLNILAGRASSNDDRAQADRWANIAFAVVLVVAAAYARRAPHHRHLQLPEPQLRHGDDHPA